MKQNKWRNKGVFRWGSGLESFSGTAIFLVCDFSLPVARFSLEAAKCESIPIFKIKHWGAGKNNHINTRPQIGHAFTDSWLIVSIVGLSAVHFARKVHRWLSSVTDVNVIFCPISWNFLCHWCKFVNKCLAHGTKFSHMSNDRCFNKVFKTKYWL